MKKTLNVLLLSAVLLGAGCAKKVEPDPCAKGTFMFVSISDQPYSIYLNDEKVKSIGLRETYYHQAFSGHYSVMIEQDSGYIATPYEKDYSIDLKGCDTVRIEIPRQSYEPPLK